ncbi:MAG: hypothetical protein ACI9MC_003046 [Kiritimatiellia bacterium]|jgi:hypothetical protein
MVRSWLRRIWLHAITMLVVLHVVAITLVALPSPGGGLDRRDWDQPTVRGEFETWTHTLNKLGAETTTEELQDRVFIVAKGYAKAHRSVWKPFQPYYHYAGTYQAWRMFVAPHRFPSRLHIRVHERGQWRSVYLARSSSLTWMSRELDHDRLRAALFRYGWGQKYPRSYGGFAAWIARRAARDFPAARQVEVRFDSYQTLTPAQVRAGERPTTRKHRVRHIALRPLR